MIYYTNKKKDSDHMFSKPKLHAIIKKLFKRVNDIDKVMIFAYKENDEWKIGFSEGHGFTPPRNTINLWVYFKNGYLNNSPSKATEDILNAIKKYVESNKTKK